MAIVNKHQLRKKIFNDALNYYRKRPEQYVTDVEGIALNFYQIVMFRAVFKSKFIVYVMSRGLGSNAPLSSD